MARATVLESFEGDFARVSSPRLRRGTPESVALLEPFPKRGSRDMPPSTRERFGTKKSSEATAASAPAYLIAD